MKAGGNVSPRRILQYGADDLHAIQATAGTDLLIGVSTIPDSEPDPIPVGATANPVVLAEDIFDIVFSGLTEVEYGADVTRGQRLTSDANGRAIPATPGDYTVGFATKDGADGDWGSLIVVQGQVDTPSA